MPFEDLKQQMKNRALTQRVMRQEVGGRITISKAELQKYYDEHKSEFVREERVFLREILISSVGKTPEQVAAAEKRAKDILARAKKGEKFHELARDMSYQYSKFQKLINADPIPGPSFLKQRKCGR